MESMMFGLMVLAATAVLLSTFRVRPLIAGLCLALLAVDPAFLFIFRTQFYITTMPIACVFLSTALIQTTRMAPTPKIAFAAGLLAGMSCYGYFIYLFFLPTIIIFALFAWRGSERLPALLISAAAGFSLFILPYFVGFGRMMW
jgi:hypothetical protein